RLHHLSVVRDVAQDGGAGHVAVPDIVIDQLVMSAPLAGVPPDRHHAVDEKAVALAADAGFVGGRNLNPQIGKAQFLIDRYLRPAAGIAGFFGFAGAQPAVIAELALHRDGVENPQPLSRLDVKTADIALGARPVAGHAAGGMGGADN